MRQTGQAIDHIKHLTVTRRIAAASGSGFWGWVLDGEGQPLTSDVAARRDWSATTRRRRCATSCSSWSCLTAAMLLLRYLREVAQAKLSMTMVFYIREAVYDKLQRVGFGFHDAVSSGQLINRALSDLQNVRTFVQTARADDAGDRAGRRRVHRADRSRVSPWVALLSLVPLPIWTWYILRFSKKVQPAAKAVMEAEDQNVSIITENIAGVHVVKAFATEKQEIDKYSANCDDVLRAGAAAASGCSPTSTPVIRAIATASHLSLFLRGGDPDDQGQARAPGDFLILGSGDGRDPRRASSRSRRSTSSTRTRSSRRGGCTRC